MGCLPCGSSRSEQGSKAFLARFRESRATATPAGCTLPAQRVTGELKPRNTQPLFVRALGSAPVGDGQAQRRVQSGAGNAATRRGSIVLSIERLLP